MIKTAFAAAGLLFCTLAIPETPDSGPIHRYLFEQEVAAESAQLGRFMTDARAAGMSPKEAAALYHERFEKE